MCNHDSIPITLEGDSTKAYCRDCLEPRVLKEAHMSEQESKEPFDSGAPWTIERRGKDYAIHRRASANGEPVVALVMDTGFYGGDLQATSALAQVIAKAPEMLLHLRDVSGHLHALVDTAGWATLDKDAIAELMFSLNQLDTLLEDLVLS